MKFFFTSLGLFLIIMGGIEFSMFVHVGMTRHLPTLWDQFLLWTGLIGTPCAIFGGASLIYSAWKRKSP